MIYQGKQKIWSDYQKEIPDDNWYYVRSCIRQNFFPASEKMFMEICELLIDERMFAKDDIGSKALDVRYTRDH